MKAGEVVCELDSANLVDKAKQQEISVTIAESAETEASTGVKITETQNQSSIAAAELSLKLAQLDLKKYKEGDFPQQQNKLKGEVEVAKEQVVRGEEAYDFTREMSRKGFRNANDVEAARIQVKQNKLSLQAKEEELNVLEEFTKERTIAELEAKAQELVREVDRVKLEAEAQMSKAQKLLQTRQQTLTSEREILAKLKAQIDACTLRAPQDGQVVYANLDSSSRRSDGSGGIELGAQVRERQSIINLPDITQMKVECRVHESLISAIHEGVPARIRIVSYPDKVFNGKVTSVSSVAMSGRWPNTDLREYRTEITLTDDIETIKMLRPGLTAMVELLVDSRNEVLQVPIQSIVTVGMQNYVFVLTRGGPERREVTVGMNNTSHMEITKGLEAGEQVVQNPRHAFEDEIGQLEAELETSRAKESAEAGAAAAPEGGAAATGPNAGGPQGGPPRGGPGGAGGSGAPGGGAGSGRPSPQAMISNADKDGDGKLSEAEAPEQMKASFAEIDTDKDGFLTADELAARFAKRQGGGGGRQGGGDSPPGGRP
ncbi:MAG: HlyD family efflux transporter periplasmic adaptor subunit [Planctomycetaceae bacterium]